MCVEPLGARMQQLVPLRWVQDHRAFLFKMLQTWILQSQASTSSRLVPITQYVWVCRFSERQQSVSWLGPHRFGQAVLSVLSRLSVRKRKPVGGVYEVEAVKLLEEEVSKVMKGSLFQSKSRRQSCELSRQNGTWSISQPPDVSTGGLTGSSMRIYLYI